MYLGLGSNVGDRLHNIRRGIEALSAHVRLDAISSLYETAPMYEINQPFFFNAVVGGETDLALTELLSFLKKIETDMGRIASARFGPRPIDFDILFYDDLVLTTPALTIPHSRIAERAFVLVPLSDIAPDLMHPTLHVTVAELRDRLTDSAGEIKKIEAVL